MENPRNQKLAYVMAMVSVVIWSSAFAASRYSLVYYSPMSLMLLRFLVASATLVIIGAARGIRLPKKSDVPKFAVGGFVGLFLYMVFFNAGSVTVVSGVGSFVIASAPVYTLILSRVLLKETVRPVGWLGVAVSFCGLVVVMLSQVTEFSFNTGVLLMLGSAISTSGHNIIQRSLLKTYSALESTTYTVIAATIFMLVFLPGAIREFPGAPLDINLVVVYLGVFPAALGYLAWGFTLSKAEKTTHVTVFLYLIPFTASLIAYVWLRETFTLMSLFGGIVIIAGMLMTNTLGKSKTTP